MSAARASSGMRSIFLPRTFDVATNDEAEDVAAEKASFQSSTVGVSDSSQKASVQKGK